MERKKFEDKNEVSAEVSGNDPETIKTEMNAITVDQEVFTKLNGVTEANFSNNILKRITPKIVTDDEKFMKIQLNEDNEAISLTFKQLIKYIWMLDEETDSNALFTKKYQYSKIISDHLVEKGKESYLSYLYADPKIDPKFAAGEITRYLFDKRAIIDEYVPLLTKTCAKNLDEIWGFGRTLFTDSLREGTGFEQTDLNNDRLIHVQQLYNTFGGTIAGLQSLNADVEHIHMMMTLQEYTQRIENDRKQKIQEQHNIDNNIEIENLSQDLKRLVGQLTGDEKLDETVIIHTRHLKAFTKKFFTTYTSNEQTRFIQIMNAFNSEETPLAIKNQIGIAFTEYFLISNFSYHKLIGEYKRVKSQTATTPELIQKKQLQLEHIQASLLESHNFMTLYQMIGNEIPTYEAFKTQNYHVTPPPYLSDNSSHFLLSYRGDAQSKIQDENPGFGFDRRVGIERKNYMQNVEFLSDNRIDDVLGFTGGLVPGLGGHGGQYVCGLQETNTIMQGGTFAEKQDLIDRYLCIVDGYTNLENEPQVLKYKLKLMERMMVKEGRPSLFAIQLRSSHLLTEYSSLIKDANEGKAIGPDVQIYQPSYNSPDTPRTVFPWRERVNEVGQLLEEIMDLDDAHRSQARNKFKQGFGRGPTAEKRPFVGNLASMSRHQIVNTLYQKQQSDESLENHEQLYLSGNLMHMQASTIDFGPIFSIGIGTQESVTFMAEMICMSPALSTFKLAASSSATIGKQVTMKGMKLILKGTAATVINIPATAKSFYNSTQQSLGVTYQPINTSAQKLFDYINGDGNSFPLEFNEIGSSWTPIISKEGSNAFLHAFLKTFSQSSINYTIEMAGGTLLTRSLAFMSRPGGALAKSADQNLASKFLEYLLKKEPTTVGQQVANAAYRDGLLPEYFEEFLQMMTDNAFEGNDIFQTTLRQQAETLAIVTIIQGGMKSLTTTIDLASNLINPSLPSSFTDWFTSQYPGKNPAQHIPILSENELLQLLYEFNASSTNSIDESAIAKIYIFRIEKSGKAMPTSDGDSTIPDFDNVPTKDTPPTLQEIYENMTNDNNRIPGSLHRISSVLTASDNSSILENHKDQIVLIILHAHNHRNSRTGQYLGTVTVGDSTIVIKALSPEDRNAKFRYLVSEFFKVGFSNSDATTTAKMLMQEGWCGDMNIETSSQDPTTLINEIVTTYHQNEEISSSDQEILLGLLADRSPDIQQKVMSNIGLSALIYELSSEQGYSEYQTIIDAYYANISLPGVESQMVLTYRFVKFILHDSNLHDGKSLIGNNNDITVTLSLIKDSNSNIFQNLLNEFKEHIENTSPPLTQGEQAVLHNLWYETGGFFDLLELIKTQEYGFIGGDEYFRKLALGLHTVSILPKNDNKETIETIGANEVVVNEILDDTPLTFFIETNTSVVPDFEKDLGLTSRENPNENLSKAFASNVETLILDKRPLHLVVVECRKFAKQYESTVGSLKNGLSLGFGLIEEVAMYDEILQRLVGDTAGIANLKLFIEGIVELRYTMLTGINEDEDTIDMGAIHEFISHFVAPGNSKDMEEFKYWLASWYVGDEVDGEIPKETLTQIITDSDNNKFDKQQIVDLILAGFFAHSPDFHEFADDVFNQGTLADGIATLFRQYAKGDSNALDKALSDPLTYLFPPDSSEEFVLQYYLQNHGVSAYEIGAVFWQYIRVKSPLYEERTISLPRYELSDDTLLALYSNLDIQHFLLSQDGVSLEELGYIILFLESEFDNSNNETIRADITTLFNTLNKIEQEAYRNFKNFSNTFDLLQHQQITQDTDNDSDVLDLFGGIDNDVNNEQKGRLHTQLKQKLSVNEKRYLVLTGIDVDRDTWMMIEGKLSQEQLKNDLTSYFQSATVSSKIAWIEFMLGIDVETIEGYSKHLERRFITGHQQSKDDFLVTINDNDNKFLESMGVLERKDDIVSLDESISLPTIVSILDTLGIDQDTVLASPENLSFFWSVLPTKIQGQTTRINMIFPGLVEKIMSSEEEVRKDYCTTILSASGLIANSEVTAGILSVHAIQVGDTIGGSIVTKDNINQIKGLQLKSLLKEQFPGINTETIKTIISQLLQFGVCGTRQERKTSRERILGKMVELTLPSNLSLNQDQKIQALQRVGFDEGLLNTYYTSSSKTLSLKINTTSGSTNSLTYILEGEGISIQITLYGKTKTVSLDSIIVKNSSLQAKKILKSLVKQAESMRYTSITATASRSDYSGRVPSDMIEKPLRGYSVRQDYGFVENNKEMPSGISSVHAALTAGVRSVNSITKQKFLNHIFIRHETHEVPIRSNIEELLKNFDTMKSKLSELLDRYKKNRNEYRSGRRSLIQEIHEIPGGREFRLVYGNTREAVLNFNNSNSMTQFNNHTR